jgi:hypothetical protein
MENWWQLSYVSSNLKTLPNHVEPSTLPPPTPPDFNLPPPGGSSGPEGFGSPALPPPPSPVPHTNFYEDIFNGGSRLALGAGRQYEDLTEVPWTFFGTGDWNDTISSIEMILTHTTILLSMFTSAGQRSPLARTNRTCWFMGGTTGLPRSRPFRVHP